MNKEYVHRLFEQQVLADPAAIAVESGIRALTYGELNTNANHLAWLLKTFTPGKTMIGVLMDTGICYISSILAILKSGNVFMPMDARIPDRRLQLMIDESGTSVLVASREYLHTISILNEKGNIAYLVIPGDETVGAIVYEWAEGKFRESDPDTLAASDDENPPLAAEPGDSCYVFFTSGSTGTPKGILGRHISLAHFINWEINEFNIVHTARVSQLTPITFDPSLRDIFIPLCSGATLCIPPPGIKEDHLALLDWIDKTEISLIHIIPTLFRMLTKVLAALPAPAAKLQSLKYVLLAGEPLYGYDIVNWSNIMGDRIELINLYGPTETTLAKFFHRIRDHAQVGRFPNMNVPVGRPISNTVDMILENGKICPIGAVGEMYIRTPFMSNGYISNRKLNENVFIQNPLHNEYPDIVYKTGDLARYLPDGSIELVGRKDFQLKINGVRVELEEIEYHLRNFSGIDQPIVIAKEILPHEKKLVCYYLKKYEFSESELRDHLGLHLPESMIPSYFVALKEIPLLLNGKVDKKALPDPDLTTGRIYVEPATVTEMKLLDIWKDIFQIHRIGVLDSFINLGGNSLNAIQVMTKINAQLNAGIRLGDILRLTNIRNIAAEIDRRTVPAESRIEPLSPQTFYNLSFLQRSYWLLEQMSGGGNAYVMSGAYRLDGHLDAESLEKALRTVWERHEILRTVIVFVGGELRQVINERDRPGRIMRYEDHPGRSPNDKDIRKLLLQELSTGFDLEKGPLFRTSLFRLSHDTSIFQLTMHHIIADGWSVAMLINEISILYNTYRVGLENPLRPLRIQYKDYSAWYDDQLKKGAFDSDRAYWLDQFRHPPAALQLPADFPRPAIKSYNGAELTFNIERDLVARMRECCTTHDVSLFVLLATALNTLLYKYGGKKDIVIGTAVAGRDHPDLAGQIGLYSNNLALRTQIDEGEDFERLLRKVNRNILEALDHQSYPFEMLVGDLESDRDLGRSPVFDVFILLQNFDSIIRQQHDLTGIKVTPLEQQTGSSKFDLCFVFWDDGHDLGMSIEYNTDLFLPGTIEWFYEGIMNIFRSAANAPEILLSDSALL